MNNSTRVAGRPRRAWPPTARTSAAIIAAATLALPVATFGSSTSSTSPGGTTNPRPLALLRSTNTEQALAYSRCMRSHGVPNFPDPGSNGAFPKVTPQQLGVSSSQFQAAQRACQHLLPNSGESPQAWDQQLMNALWKFARCVRANGVPNWPDPVAESDPGEPGTAGFPRNLNGINMNSPQVKNAMHKCQYLLAGFGYASGGYP